VERELRAIVGDEAVLTDPGLYLTDITGLQGNADAVVLPSSTDEVARVVAWCYEHEVQITPRGGGTGVAGGAVPLEGGIVLALDRLARVRAFDPLLWRLHVEAGVCTAAVHALARQNGLMFAPDPGAAEQSQIGGNIATNAAGPHAYKYGATGTWVTGLEAVVPPGDVVTVGGSIRKDVAGYDLKSLLIGSEGTLGIITAAWLRLIPAPEVTLPVASFHADTASGCEAILRVVGSGIRATAIEFLDGETLVCAGGSFDGPLPDGAGFMVIAEADGSEEEAASMRSELIEVLGESAVAIRGPSDRAGIEALWRWRSGLAFAVLARRGLAISEDIVVPLDRLAEAIEETAEIGRRHDLTGLSFGHAGDGNLHSTFLFSPEIPEEGTRASQACEELVDLAVRLGGSISGEHGTGYLKRGQLAKQWPPRALELHAAVKHVFDPKGLLNSGKKIAYLPDRPF
jgi:glycolate dehydrogenase FAD-linked subunit